MFEDSAQVVRHGVERAFSDFTQRVAPLNFTRSKRMFWTRLRFHTVDFVHIHPGGSSYGNPINYSVDFRAHLGIRVLNDSFPAPSLNGPCSDDLGSMLPFHYHLRFNAKSGSTYERCLDDLVRFLLEQGEPWFRRFCTAEALLNFEDSPLQDSEKQGLREATAGQTNPKVVSKSLALLGIKRNIPSAQVNDRP